MGEWDNLDWGAFDPYAGSVPTLGWTGDSGGFGLDTGGFDPNLGSLGDFTGGTDWNWLGQTGGMADNWWEAPEDPGAQGYTGPGGTATSAEVQKFLASQAASTGGSGSSSILDSAIKGILGIGGTLLNNLLTKPKPAIPSSSGVTIDQKARNSVYATAMPYQEALLNLLSDAGMTPAESQEWQNALMTQHELLPYQYSTATGLLDKVRRGAELSKYSIDAADLAYKYSAPNEQELEEIKRDMRLYYGHGADEALTMDKINKYVLDSRRQAAEILASIGKQAEALGIQSAALIPGGIQAYQSLVGPDAMAKQIALAGADKTKTMEDVRALQALTTLAQMFAGMSTLPYSKGSTPAQVQNPEWANIIPTLLQVLYPQPTNTKTTGETPTTPTNDIGTAIIDAIKKSIGSVGTLS